MAEALSILFFNPTLSAAHILLVLLAHVFQDVAGSFQFIKWKKIIYKNISVSLILMACEAVLT